MKEPKTIDWRKDTKRGDFDPDDQELVHTPPDVVAVLGFDPKYEDGEDVVAASLPHDVSGEARDAAGKWTAGVGYVPSRHALAKPIKGPTGAEIVGYEWKSHIDNVWSEGKQEYVEKRVSDWGASDTSTGTGRDIVHVFHVLHKDGIVRPEGIRSAQNVLGISETRLQTIAKHERIAQQWRQQQEKAEAEQWEKSVKPTPAEAAQHYRKVNYSAMRSFEDNDRIFRESVLFEKGGKFIRRHDKATDAMLRNGWTKVSVTIPTP